MSETSNIFKFRYIGPDNYAMGLRRGKVYTVGMGRENGYIAIKWKTKKCLYTSLVELNKEWVDP